MQFDLHVHTKYSFDCAMKPKKIVEVVKKMGLDGIAITDHNNIEGAYEVQKYAKDSIIVIIGEEIGTPAGDIIGLFIKDHIKATNPLEVIDEIKKQGGIAVLAHPLAHHPNLTDNILRKLDGCEGFNARHARHKKPNTPYGENHLVKFAKKYNYFLVAGSDAHFYHEIGKGRTIIPAENLQDIKEAIISGFTTLEGTRTSPLYLFATTLYKITNIIFNPVPEEKLFIL